MDLHTNVWPSAYGTVSALGNCEPVYTFELGLLDDIADDNMAVIRRMLTAHVSTLVNVVAAYMTTEYRTFGVR
jgi:hypothetical protein